MHTLHDYYLQMPAESFKHASLPPFEHTVAAFRLYLSSISERRTRQAAGLSLENGSTAALLVEIITAERIEIMVSWRPDMLKRWVITGVVCAILCVSMSSCTTLYNSSPKYDISGVFEEYRTNGLVFKIVSAKYLKGVEAWLGEDNWLYITIPDSSMKVSQLHSLDGSKAVEKTQFYKHQSSVQVTIKLKQKFDHVDVLRYPDDRNTYVVLYHFKQD